MDFSSITIQSVVRRMCCIANWFGRSLRYCETKSADDIIIRYRISKLVIFFSLSYVEQTDDLNWPIRNADNDRKIHPFNE